jgi:hypothetical protein
MVTSGTIVFKIGDENFRHNIMRIAPWRRSASLVVLSPQRGPAGFGEEAQ